MRARRRLALVLLLALAAAPPAAAQAEETLPPITVRVDAFPPSVPPLSGVAVANVTVDVPCRLLVEGPSARPALDLAILESPAWATISLSPSRAFPPPAHECPAPEPWRFTGNVLASVTAEAPAFAPAPVRVEAVLESSGGTSRAEGGTNLSAGYFSILDEQTLDPVRNVEAGETVRVPVTLTNYGNAASRILFTVTDQPRGWSVELPEGLVIASRQETPDAAFSGTVDIAVTAPDSAPRTGDGRILVAATAAHAERSELTGDRVEVALLLRVPGGVPVAPILGAVALVGVAALGFVLHRRRRP